MRKIKGFKLLLRPHEVKRRAKKAGINLEMVDLPDIVLEKTLTRLEKTISPGVLFDTFGHPDPDQALLSPLPGLAYSLVLACLGDGFTDEIKSKEDKIPADLWPILEDVGLDECVRFAANILADDAEKDNCELSPVTLLSDEAALAAVLKKLEASKLNVSLLDGKLNPSPSLAVSLSWLARSKSKGRK